MLRPTMLTLVGLSVLLSGPGIGGEVTGTQTGRAFSERDLTIRAGDTLKFLNDDVVVHNVYSITDGHAFDLGAQAPGTTASHTFTAPGKLKVRWAIHPKMKLDVVVQEAAAQPWLSPRSTVRPEVWHGELWPDHLTWLLVAGAVPWSSPVTAAGVNHTIEIISDYGHLRMYFEPKMLHIAPGDTVTWVNRAAEEHDIVSFLDGYPEGATPLRSPLMREAGQTWSYRFAIEGTYEYHCLPHLPRGMHGVAGHRPMTSFTGLQRPSSPTTASSSRNGSTARSFFVPGNSVTPAPPVGTRPTDASVAAMGRPREPAT